MQFLGLHPKVVKSVTNAVSIFRFCWGFGGVAGAVVGGACKLACLVTRRIHYLLFF